MRPLLPLLFLAAAACGGPSSTRPSVKGPYHLEHETVAYAVVRDHTTATSLAEEQTELGEITVRLRELRDHVTASCAVTIENERGTFVAEDFLCWADRDEQIATDEVSITIEPDRATIRFRVSYAIAPAAPAVERHTIVCTLGAQPSCTPPPAVGGYASSFDL